LALQNRIKAPPRAKTAPSRRVAGSDAIRVTETASQAAELRGIAESPVETLPPALAGREALKAAPKAAPKAAEKAARRAPRKEPGKTAPNNAARQDPAIAVEAGQTEAGSPMIATNGEIIDTLALVFDPDWYRAEYPDVTIAGVDPIRHFFDNGAREGRNPNPYFDTSWYLGANADVAASQMNPFLHFILYGAREGRRPRH
jgi:hypothetical protein